MPSRYDHQADSVTTRLLTFLASLELLLRIPPAAPFAVVQSQAQWLDQSPEQALSGSDWQSSSPAERENRQVRQMTNKKHQHLSHHLALKCLLGCCSAIVGEMLSWIRDVSGMRWRDLYRRKWRRSHHTRWMDRELWRSFQSDDLKKRRIPE